MKFLKDIIYMYIWITSVFREYFVCVNIWLWFSPLHWVSVIAFNVNFNNFSYINDHGGQFYWWRKQEYPTLYFDYLHILAQIESQNCSIFFT